MADSPARPVQRRSDERAAGTMASETPGRFEPVPTPVYQGLFVEPDLPPFVEAD